MKKYCVTQNLAKLLVFFFIFLSASISAGEENLKIFQYDTLPFGQSSDEIFSTLNLEKIKPEFTPSASEIVAYKGLGSEFSGGLYTYLEVFTSFNTDIVKLYTIKLYNNKDVEQIDLFFVLINSTEKLFLIRKQIHSPRGLKYDKVFELIKNGIDSKLKKRGTKYNVKYQDFNMMNNNTYEPALVSVWRDHKKSVILGVRNGLFESDSPDMIYRDEILWNQYISICKKLEKQKLKKAKEDSEKTIKNF